MTLRPAPYDPEIGGVVAAILEAAASWRPTSWITFDVVESASNVVLFVPLGMLVVLWGGRWWQGVLIGLAVSGVIETAQLLFLPTRVADVRDLVANTGGAAIGAIVTAAGLHRNRLRQFTANT